MEITKKRGRGRPAKITAVEGSLYDIIAKRCEAAGSNILNLATVSGISHNTVYYWQKNTNVRPDTLTKIANGLAKVEKRQDTEMVLRELKLAILKNSMSVVF